MATSRKAVLTAVVSDLAIAAAKLTAFAFSHSSAKLAKSIHSLVDAGNGSLLVLGTHLSKRPAHETHPFGYGKELYFWTLLVALFIFLVGGGVSIAFAGTGLDQAFGWHRADGIASILIGAMLTAVAVLLVIESKALLVGEGPIWRCSERFVRWFRAMYSSSCFRKVRWD